MSIEWRERAGEIWTVPNLISLSRLPLVAGIAFTLDSPLRYVLFALIVFSDGVDGWVARKLDQTTELGAMLDPALDKFTALVVVAILFPRLDLPLAYLVLFFARDIFVVSLVPLVPLYGFDTSKVQARLPGKVVTNLQFLAMIAMLVPSVAATETLLWATGLASALAITDYVVFVARELSERPWVHDRRGAVAATIGVVAAYALVVRLLLYEELVDWLATLS
ncbi:CDP-alcohol phosphatidyltransferase family protein [Halosimplex sp. J119]